MNRFEKIFVDKLATFCKENGYIITESGTIEKLEDWVDPSKPFEYLVEEEGGVLKIKEVVQ